MPVGLATDKHLQVQAMPIKLFLDGNNSYVFNPNHFLTFGVNRIVVWFQQPFRLLDSQRARWKLVVFCGVFGCLFVNIFQPFNLTEWFVTVKTPLFIILTFFSAAGMAALALSQFAIRSLFKVEYTSRANYMLWLLVEFFLITIAMHCVNVFFLKVPFINLPEYLLTLKYTLGVLILPYFFALLMLYIEEQLQVVQQLTLKVNRATTADTVTIQDENGKAVLTLPLKNILYFKSEDNYITLYYKQDNEVRKELIRTSLKKIEQELNLATLIRIHRSFMVNTQNLMSAAKTSRGYQVKMEFTTEPLPVSATYQSAFEEKVIQKPA